MPKRATLTDEMCCKHKVRICWKRRTFSASGSGVSLQTERYMGAAKARNVADRVRIAGLGNIESWAEVMVGSNSAGEIWTRVELPEACRHG